MFFVPLYVGGIRHRGIGGHGIDKAGYYNVGQGNFRDCPRWGRGIYCSVRKS